MKYIFFPVKFVIWFVLSVIHFIMFLIVLPFAFIGGMKKSSEDMVRWSTHKDDCIVEVVHELSDIFLMDHTDHFFNLVNIWAWKGFIEYEEYLDDNGFLALRHKADEKGD